MKIYYLTQPEIIILYFNLLISRLTTSAYSTDKLIIVMRGSGCAQSTTVSFTDYFTNKEKVYFNNKWSRTFEGLKFVAW